MSEEHPTNLQLDSTTSTAGRPRRGMGAACVWIVLLVVSSGCCSLIHVGDAATSRQGNVFLVRAVGGYWPCLENLETKLKQRGLQPTTIYGWERGHLVEDIHAAKRQGRLSSPLILAGYSLGANHAINLCRDLQRRGITVDGLILLETTFHDTVPANVRYCFNMYHSRPETDCIPIFRGLPLEAEHPATQVVNHDLRFDRNAEYFQSINHLQMGGDPIIQEILAVQTARLCPLAVHSAMH